MARGLFRGASAPQPAVEPGFGDPICVRCGRRKTWIVGPCDRAGCPGFWAWRCPAEPERHGEPDDALDVATHGLSHDLREQELRVEGFHACPGCGARDWEAGEWWAPGNLLAVRFTCRRCWHAIPVSTILLRVPERDGPETKRPGRWDPRWPCPCGRATMQPDCEWYGPECACCGGVIYYPVANPYRPLCRICQPNPRADEILFTIIGPDGQARKVTREQVGRCVIEGF